MAINENATSTGHCHALTFEGDRPSWETIQSYVHGLIEAPSNLIEHNVYKNRLSDTALSSGAKLWVGEYVKLPSKIKLGTGAPTPPQTTPLTTDSDCWTPDNTTEKSLDLVTTFLSVYAEYGVTYATDEANDVAYTEALLYDEDDVAWAHVILNFSKTSASPKTGVILWKVLQSQGTS